MSPASLSDTNRCFCVFLGSISTSHNFKRLLFQRQQVAVDKRSEARGCSESASTASATPTSARPSHKATRYKRGSHQRGTSRNYRTTTTTMISSKSNMILDNSKLFLSLKLPESSFEEVNLNGDANKTPVNESPNR